MYSDYELHIEHLNKEIKRLNKQIAKLNDEKNALHKEYLNYMEYSELTIMELAVEIKKLKGIDNTMSPEEFHKLFEECKLNELDYYSNL